MNKSLLLIISVILGLTANAQMPYQHSEKLINPKQITASKAYGQPQTKDVKMHNSKGSASAWFHHASAVSNAVGVDIDNFSTSSFYLFKDTSANILYSDGTLEPVWWIAAAGVVDPSDGIYDYMNSDPSVDEFNKNTSYTFDSLGFNSIYIRNSASNVVDTLAITIQKNHTKFVDITYGSDVIVGLPWIYHDLHKWSTTTANANVVTVIKIPLDSTMASRDTIINGETQYFYKFMQIATDLANTSFNSSDLPKVSMTFIPGYSYIPNVDTLFGADNPIMNSFRILTYKTDASNAQIYLNENSCSYFFSRQFAKASSTSTGYMPFYLYMMDPNNADFRYEYFDFYFHYSTNNVSIGENENNTFNVEQNQPNPFNGTTVINYGLTKKSTVAVEVFNVAGSKVMSINEGEKSMGNHTITIDASSLNAGIYYYSVIVNAKRVTKKMIVY